MVQTTTGSALKGRVRATATPAAAIYKDEAVRKLGKMQESTPRETFAVVLFGMRCAEELEEFSNQHMDRVVWDAGSSSRARDGVKLAKPVELKDRRIRVCRSGMYFLSNGRRKHEMDSLDGKTSGWPTKRFSRASTEGDPWMFRMTGAFIDHCTDTIRKIAIGIEKLKHEGESEQFQAFCRL